MEELLKSRGRLLTDQEQKDVMKLWSEGMGKTDIGKKLGIDYKPLKRFFDDNNIANRKQGIPYEYYEPIFKLYSSGLTLKQIHDNYYPQFTADQINYICREKGITRPNGKVAILNHDYFDVIDSNEKAYWLGLIAADGSIKNDKKKGNSWTITLELMKQDKYLVEAFAKAVETNLEVKEYINPSGFQRQDGQPHIECRIVLSSVKMVNDLITKYNIVPNKSLLLNKLPNIEDQYMSHYIRGFIDGNGSITYHKMKDKYKVPRILIYSTHNFCNNINKYLEKHVGVKINKIYDQKKEKMSFISFAAFNDILKIYNYLYKDASIYMIRKKQKLEDLISEYRDNHAA